MTDRPSLSRSSDLRRLLTRLALGAACAPVACTGAADDPPAETDGVDTEVADTAVDDTLPDDTLVVDTVVDTVVDSEPLPDTGDTDPDVGDTDAPVDSDPADTVVAPSAVPADALAPGDLVVTEAMFDPVDCMRAIGQYLEVKNVRGERVNLRGVRLKVGASTAVLSPTADLLVEPGAYLLVGGSGLGGCWPAPALPDTTWPGITALPLSGALVELRTPSNGLIDAVDFRSIRLGADGVTVTDAGRALHLVGAEDATSNDDPAGWCPAEGLLPRSTADHGSPHARAVACRAPVGSDTDTDLPDTDTDAGDTDTDAGDTDTDLPDTDGLPGPWTSSCHGGGWNPLSYLHTPAPHTHLLAALDGTYDTAWWDSAGAQPFVVDEVGVRCADAVDPVACAADLDAQLAQQTDRMVASTDGGVTQVWAGPAAILSVLGEIDTLDEAVLHLWSLGYAVRWCGDVVAREEPGGYGVLVTTMVSDCPIRYEDWSFRVDRDGTTRFLGSTPSDDTGGGCIGRRPPGLDLPPVDAALGPLLARHAALEAASVVAFDHLHAELVALHAPADLLRRVRAAARDERRHADQVGALARRYGCAPEAPRVRPTPLRDALAIALDNAVEGCVGETWGALLGTWQADHAGDPVVAATMRRIARDEVRHAALSWALDAWLHDRLDDDGRARVAAAKRDAVTGLRERASRAVDPSRVARLGLPDAATSERLVDGLADALAA